MSGANTISKNRKRSQLVSLSIPWKEERKICHSHLLKRSYDSVTDLWFCQLRQVLSGFFFPHLDVSFCGIYWNYTCFPIIGWLIYVTFVFIIVNRGSSRLTMYSWMPYIQMIVSSVKSENIPHFYYLHFYILLSWSSVQKSMKAYFRWEWKCY